MAEPDSAIHNFLDGQGDMLIFYCYGFHDNPFFDFPFSIGKVLLFATKTVNSQWILSMSLLLYFDNESTWLASYKNIRTLFHDFKIKKIENTGVPQPFEMVKIKSRTDHGSVTLVKAIFEGLYAININLGNFE